MKKFYLLLFSIPAFGACLPVDQKSALICNLIQKDDHFRRLVADRFALSLVLSFSKTFELFLVKFNDFVQNSDLILNNSDSLKLELENVSKVMDLMYQDNHQEIMVSFNAAWNTVFGKNFERSDVPYLNTAVSSVQALLTIDGIDMQQEIDEVVSYADNNPVVFHYVLKWVNTFIESVDSSL